MARQGRSAEAIAGYKKALQENPEFGLAHYNLANLLYRQGKLAGDRERYLRAIECDPDIVEAHLNLGTLLADEGKRDAARDRLEKALSLAQAQGNVELAETIRGELRKLSPS
jgi:tetratricopeptide (TPR) repeat protein